MMSARFSRGTLVQGIALALMLASGSLRADSFFDSVVFDTSGALPPHMTNTQAFSFFLDTHPDVFAHEKAVVLACGPSNVADGAALFARRLDDDSDDVLRIFDAALAQVVHGCSAGDDSAIASGLASLKSVCGDTGNPGMWLAYALCLANVDIFQIGRSKYRGSPMKDVAMQAVRRAAELDARYPHRGFALSLQSLLEYMALYPAYKPFCTEMRAPSPPRRAPSLEYMNGMLVIRAAHPLAGRRFLAAAFARRVWLLNLDEWRIVARADNVDSYCLAGDGSLLAARVDGALLAWRGADGGVAAHVPRVATWDIVGDGSLAAIANHFAPLNAYDIDLVRLDGGAVAATLARRFNHDVTVRDVAVSRDGAFAAVYYWLAGRDGGVDVWNLRSGVRVGTMAYPGGRSVGFSPDSRRLMCGMQDGSYRFLDMHHARSAPEAVFGTNCADIVVTPRRDAPRSAFLSGGATFICWSAEKSDCDGFDVYNLEDHGHLVATQQPTNGFDGVAIAEDGGRLAAWCGTRLVFWQADNLAAPAFETTLAARVTAAACAPAAPLLAAATDDGLVHVWCLGGDEPRPLVPLATGDHGISSLSFEHEARWLVAHNASNVQVYVALLRQGGMFDSSPVVGWNPLTTPRIGVPQATATNVLPAAPTTTNSPAAMDARPRSQ